MREVLNELLGAASRPLEGGKQILNLAAPMDNALSSSCATELLFSRRHRLEVEYSFSGRLGVVAKRGADIDESHDAHPGRMRFQVLAPAV